MTNGSNISGSVNQAIDAMKTSPVTLGMVILNLAMIGMLFYVLRYVSESRRQEFEMIFASQKEVQQLLANCSAPAPR